MKGLVKEFLLFSAIFISLYLLLSQTKIVNDIFSSVTGFFLSIFSSKESKTISFEIYIPNYSETNILAQMSLSVEGNLLESYLSDIAISQTSNPILVKASCKNECKITLTQKTMKFDGILNSIVFDEKLQLARKDGINVMFDFENIKDLNITINSKDFKICSSEMNIKVKVGVKELEQKINNDCIEIKDSIKVSVIYSNANLMLVGYANSLKSSFINI
ncbi:MAG: hypothetical protein QW409_01485 [Candidatus Aenigmatarchaeota archaeon]